MNIVRVTFAALLILSGPALVASEPVEAILVVPHVRILPGVPFDFWVEVHNRSDSARRISICGPFQVRLVSGEPFQWTETPAQTRPGGQYDWTHHGGETYVRPGETTFLVVPAPSGFVSGAFFAERLFSAPGRRFAIALPLCDQVFGSTASQTVGSRLMTSEVEIDIVSPSGTDALVWSHIEKASKERWTPADMASPHNRALWESIIRDFPDSNYVPYAVVMTGTFTLNDWRDCLARQLRTIKRFPESPAAEWLHVEAWRMARMLRLHGVMLAEGAILRQSKRPTTRLLAFGNEQR